MITEYMQAVATLVNFVMTVGSVAGIAVLEYSILDGMMMLWDKIVHGIAFFD